MSSFESLQALYPEFTEEQQQVLYQQLSSLSELIFTQVLHDISSSNL